MLIGRIEDNDRIVLRLKPALAPYKAAVFPLLKNKPELVEKAQDVFKGLGRQFAVTWDERGNIGKRYYSQDEIGTPFCITIDFQTLENDTVTVRERDSMQQERVAINDLRVLIYTYRRYLPPGLPGRAVIGSAIGKVSKARAVEALC